MTKYQTYQNLITNWDSTLTRWEYGMSVKRDKGLKGKATSLHSIVTRMYGACENCGKDSSNCQLQCAHINSRRYNSTRALLTNAFCLCAGCHRYFTDHPREFSRFITGTWHQDMYDQVFEFARSSKSLKTDWQLTVDFLKEMQAEISSGNMSVDDARRHEFKEVFET